MKNEETQSTAITPLFSAEAIEMRIREIGKAISLDFASSTIVSPLLLIIVLKGAFIFAADLLRTITIPCAVDFIHASSYGSEKISSGKVSINHNLAIEGRHVLIIEDIVDTGLTIQQIEAELVTMKPASLSICSLLDKPEARKHPIAIRYIGFIVPNAFIVGYGTDFNEQYREFPFLGIIDSSSQSSSPLP